MHFSDANRRHAALAVIAGGFVAAPAFAAPLQPLSAADPFAVLDPQAWVNPDNMTWEDYVVPPGTNWGNPAVKGSERNFNIALVTVDYPDQPFVVTQEAESTIFKNPQPIVSKLDRANVPTYYRDLLNKPQELNGGHTLHEYWMGDSHGRFGVDLTSFGPYKMAGKLFQYGIDDEGFNKGECPEGQTCTKDLRTDALGAWRKEVGNEEADSYELVFILSAGQDESSTWQEFGEMKFQRELDVPDEFGPPKIVGGHDTNYANTRYVPWTSWASAATIWPNAGSGSSTQGESSGMGVYAHELSHLLSIGDNYNNPYGKPPIRAYTGPWSMMSRGSFNGPGGPHTRWQIPALQGGSMGALHTVRDKLQLGLIAKESVLTMTQDQLAKGGIAVTTITARAIDPGADKLIGMRITMPSDRSPSCSQQTDPLCDGGRYNNYDVEVVDRMGADSFTPDSGVMISKTKNSDRSQPFQWTIDANPQDIDIIDFYRPDGTISKVTIGDYRQLADALFHAGTRSGSEFEYVDKANRLHFYIINRARDDAGVLTYTVAARDLGGAGSAKRGVEVAEGTVEGSAAAGAVSCVFNLKNTGTGAANAPKHFNADVYRLSAEVEGEGWKIELPNALAAVDFGAEQTARVAVAAEGSAAGSAIVRLTAISEADQKVTASAECAVSK